MSFLDKTVRIAAAGALATVLGLGGAALAQTTPAAQPAQSATSPTATPAPAAKASHHKKPHVKTHRHHRAKGMTKGAKTGATPSTGAAPATKN
ncbi:hypothetical protein [Rhodoblastus sp.]|uniref:hypothetical protein n=1 Tax=Rhodoblastus sp. TaxID=1962975 RepID=UPI002624ED9F|nr:hypothetical protein [Rhodoblastus sp.]